MDYIVRGITNKPKRDAKAISEALNLNSESKIRIDLLASRLVRYHWNIKHMLDVKAAYMRQYQGTMQQAVKDGTKGDWGLFCEVLCEDNTLEVRAAYQKHLEDEKEDKAAWELKLEQERKAAIDRYREEEEVKAAWELELGQERKIVVQTRRKAKNAEIASQRDKIAVAAEARRLDK